MANLNDLMEYHTGSRVLPDYFYGSTASEEDPPSIIGGGFAGGAAGGVAAGAVCGPGAVVCTVAIVLLGSIAGGLGAGAVVDSIDDELEEFTKWNIF